MSDEPDPWYEGRLDDRVRASAVERAGVRVVEVEVTAPLPLVGLLGPTGQADRARSRVRGGAVTGPGRRGVATGDAVGGDAVVSPDRSRPRDAGSAVVEFAALAVLLLVPLVYVCVTLGRVQAATFAAQGAASEGGRAYVTADRADDASARAQAAAALAAADQGFDARRLSLTWSLRRVALPAAGCAHRLPGDRRGRAAGCPAAARPGGADAGAGRSRARRHRRPLSRGGRARGTGSRQGGSRRACGRNTVTAASTGRARRDEVTEPLVMESLGAGPSGAGPSGAEPLDVEPPADAGQVTLLVLVYLLIALALITVVVDATAVHLARTQLLDVADGLALDAADAVMTGEGGITVDGTLPLTGDGVRRQARAGLADLPPSTRLDAVAVAVGTGADGDSAVVVLRGRVRLPIGGSVVAGWRDGVVVTVRSTARAVVSP
nr:pilus assembly protein TadG-related protein [Angustibacter aerolatus]